MVNAHCQLSQGCTKRSCNRAKRFRPTRLIWNNNNHGVPQKQEKEIILSACIAQSLQILRQLPRRLISLCLNLLQSHMVLVPPIFDGGDNLLAVSDDVAFELGNDVVVGDLKDVLLALLGCELLLSGVEMLE